MHLIERGELGDDEQQRAEQHAREDRRRETVPEGARRGVRNGPEPPVFGREGPREASDPLLYSVFASGACAHLCALPGGEFSSNGDADSIDTRPVPTAAS